MSDKIKLPALAFNEVGIPWIPAEEDVRSRVARQKASGTTWADRIGDEYMTADFARDELHKQRREHLSSIAFQGIKLAEASIEELKQYIEEMKQTIEDSRLGESDD